jgi:hypothetical protein
METLNVIAGFATIIFACVLLDWHCRGLSERRSRLALRAEVESYLKLPKLS